MDKIINRLAQPSHALNLILHILVPLVFCSMIAGFQYRAVQDARKQHLEHAQMMAHDLGSTLATSIAGSMDNVDLTLQAALDQVRQQARPGQTQTVNDSLRNLQQRLPMLGVLAATDAQGEIRFGSDTVPAELLHSPAFSAVRNAPGDAMQISLPIRDPTGGWVLICARRFDQAGSSVGGMVFATLKLDNHLAKMLTDQIKLGPTDLFLLRDDTGNTLFEYAQARPNPAAVGRKVYTEDLTRLGSNHVESGSYIARSEGDIERIYYYQRISGRPMNLLIGISVNAALLAWQREATKAWQMTGAFLFVIVLAGYLIYRSRGMQLRAFAELQRTQYQLEQTNLELARLSTTDELTGLANRRSFDEVGLHEWMRALRNHEPLAVAMLDVDFFKIFNDRYGHQSGDQCLAQIGRTLARELRDGSDFVARYGGEEFVVLLPGQSAQEAFEVLERLRGAILGLQIPHLGSSAASVITVSVGFASVVPGPGITLQNLIEQADQNLYVAKRRGKNQVVGTTEHLSPLQTYQHQTVGLAAHGSAVRQLLAGNQ